VPGEALAEVGFVAKFALVIWFPIAIVLFARFRPPVAMIATILAGIMFLPERADLQIPGFPPLDKEQCAALAALFGCTWRARGQLIRAKPGRGIDSLVLISMVLGLGTLIQNSDPLPVSPLQTLPGLTLKDLISIGIKDLLKIGMPFFLARAMLRTSRDLRDLISAYVIGGLAYSPLIPIEIRLSPQIHKWVYGYLPHYIGMALRSDGGWRPMLFMAGGGLGVAVFMAATVVAATVLMKTRKPVFGLPTSAVAFFLWGMLVITRSMGSIVYASLVAPMVTFIKPVAQTRIAVAITIIVLAYPVLRFTDHFPTDKLVDWAQSISMTRADSLKFRFDQEKFLIEKAREKPIFGWGGYGRNRVYDVWGRATITDGYWIIIMGTRGIPGFLLSFGLLAYPVFVCRRKIKLVKERVDRSLLAALSMILCVYMIDLLPNGLFNGLPFLLAGGLLGLSRSLAKEPALQPGVATAGTAPYPPQPGVQYPGAPHPEPLYRQQGPRS
jgi:hypothetical protein